jgi:cysteine desulfuration protein SufE
MSDSASLTDRAQALVEMLGLLPDDYARLTHIVDRSRQSPPLPAALRRDEFKIEGCISELWLVPEFADGRLTFRADASAATPKGVALLLCDVYSGGTPAEILALGDNFVNEAGLQRLLTSNRSNGLSQLRRKILDYAHAAQGDVKAG